MQIFHRDISDVTGSPHIVDSHDIRMTQPACRPGFLIETRLVFLALFQGQAEIDGLDRHFAIDERVACLVHDPHGTLTELIDDFVTTELADHVP